MVLMNLGLIDRPFVLHNLISNQESHVPLRQFQMAPRLKILMASGPKKGTPIYFSFLSKFPANDPFQVPQQGPYEERGPFTRHFTYISKSKSLGFPSEGVLPQGPLHGIPRRDMPQHYSPPSFVYHSSWYMRRHPSPSSYTCVFRNVQNYPHCNMQCYL